MTSPTLFSFRLSFLYTLRTRLFQDPARSGSRAGSALQPAGFVWEIAKSPKSCLAGQTKLVGTAGTWRKSTPDLTKPCGTPIDLAVGPPDDLTVAARPRDTLLRCPRWPSLIPSPSPALPADLRASVNLVRHVWVPLVGQYYMPGTGSLLPPGLLPATKDLATGPRPTAPHPTAPGKVEEDPPLPTSSPPADPTPDNTT